MYTQRGIAIEAVQWLGASGLDHTALPHWVRASHTAGDGLLDVTEPVTGRILRATPGDWLLCLPGGGSLQVMSAAAFAALYIEAASESGPDALIGLMTLDAEAAPSLAVGEGELYEMVDTNPPARSTAHRPHPPGRR